MRAIRAAIDPQRIMNPRRAVLATMGPLRSQRTHLDHAPSQEFPMLIVLSPAKRWISPSRRRSLRRPIGDSSPTPPVLSQHGPQSDPGRPAAADGHLRRSGRAEQARFKAFEPEATRRGRAGGLGLRRRRLSGAGRRARWTRPGWPWPRIHLRILSGLYGLLRPLDRIQPYRLEMGVRLKTRRGESLYDFWGDRIAKQLNADARGPGRPDAGEPGQPGIFRRGGSPRR